MKIIRNKIYEWNKAWSDKDDFLAMQKLQNGFTTQYTDDPYVGLTKEQLEKAKKSKEKTVESKIWQIVTENEPMIAARIIRENLEELYTWLTKDIT